MKKLLLIIAIAIYPIIISALFAFGTKEVNSNCEPLYSPTEIIFALSLFFYSFSAPMGLFVYFLTNYLDKDRYLGKPACPKKDKVYSISNLISYETLRNRAGFLYLAQVVEWEMSKDENKRDPGKKRIVYFRYDREIKEDEKSDQLKVFGSLHQAIFEGKEADTKGYPKFTHWN